MIYVRHLISESELCFVVRNYKNCVLIPISDWKIDWFNYVKIDVVINIFEAQYLLLPSYIFVRFRLQLFLIKLFSTISPNNKKWTSMSDNHETDLKTQTL